MGGADKLKRARPECWLLLLIFAEVPADGDTTSQYCAPADCGVQRETERYSLDTSLEAGAAGARLAQQGHMDDALARFRAAAVSRPFQPEAWVLIGRCLAAIARSNLQQSSNAQPSRQLLHEALAAYDVATLLGYGSCGM